MQSTIKRAGILATIVLVASLLTMCSKKSSTGPEPLDPSTAPRASIDRFSADAGNLFVRTASNGLPGANEPVNFDMAPFIAQGLGPDGEVVQYYNFDVQPTTPAPIYALFKEGASSPVSGQLNVVNVIPGDPGYNDFWQIYKVTVPSDYEANTVTSYQEIMDAGYPIEETNMIVNCPIVPEGSMATMRVNSSDTGLHMGWYKNKVVFYFTFGEKSLMTTGNGGVPLSIVYVSFNINPGEQGGGPASGFMTEMGSAQTHNVIATIPSDDTYSPLWSVNAYDNMDFDSVMDLNSAQSATILGAGIATVNCPVASVQ